MPVSSHVRSPLWLERLARGLVYALLFLTPLFFLPITLDVLDLNKQTLLVFLTLSASLAWLGSMHASRTISFRRGVLNLAPLLLLLAAGFAAGFSHAPYLSWIGMAGQQYTSFLSILCYVAVFYLVANLFDHPARHGAVYATLLFSALLAGILGLLTLFGVKLPFVSDAGAFNSVGTVNSLAVYLAAMTVLGNAWWMAGRANHPMSKGRSATANRLLTFAVSLVTLVVLVLLDYWILWVVLLAGLLLLFVFALVRAADFSDVGRLSMPFFLTAFALLFLFWLPTPVRLNIPIEVTPNFKGSWSVAVETAKQSPWFGTGPGTFSFGYAKMRSLNLNKTTFWDTRFDRPASFALLWPATFGLVGTLGWLLFLVPLLVLAVSRILRSKGDDWGQTFVAFAGWFTLLAGAFLYSSNVTLLVLLFALAGLIGSQVMPAPAEQRFGQSPRIGLLLSFAFILVSVGAVTLIFVTGQRYAADIAFAQAVRTDRARGDLGRITQLLDRAATINRFDDSYYRNLAQALLLQVGQEITKATKDGVQLKPEQNQRIKAFISASTTAAVRATELSPDNSQNWLIRGSVYRELIPIISDAGPAAIEAYERAVILEPNNPRTITELGRAYLAMAEAARQLTASDDEAVKTQAQQSVDINLALAEQSFNTAVSLKEDYSPSHYQLAIVAERRGKLDEAISKMESVTRYNQQDVGVAFQLGLLYLRRGGKDDLSRAQSAFEYAVQLLPSYSNARWFLASIYEQQGKLDKAIEQIQKVSELNPDNDLVKSRLERLKAGTAPKILPVPLEDANPSATSVPTGQPVKNP